MILISWTMIMLIEILLASALNVTNQQQMQESIDRMCAYKVNIPYASDNFTNEEWAKFQQCREIMNDALYHVPVN
jgi:hypothetical protein